MLRLNFSADARWIDLPHGIRAKVRPLDTAADMAAENVARVQLAAARKAAEDAGEPDRFAGDGWIGPQYALKNAHLAVLLIEAWEGVGTADGTAEQAPTPEAVSALMLRHPTVAHAFSNAIQAPLQALVTEGNASAPSRRTTSAPGRNTAPPAGSTETEGAESALTNFNRRKPPTASPHGSPGGAA